MIFEIKLISEIQKFHSQSSHMIYVLHCDIKEGNVDFVSILYHFVGLLYLLKKHSFCTCWVSSILLVSSKFWEIFFWAFGSDFFVGTYRENEEFLQVQIRGICEI
jgi:hypothetical protein